MIFYNTGYGYEKSDEGYVVTHLQVESRRSGKFIDVWQAFLYRQEVNVPTQYGSWMPAFNPIPDDKPASDLSDITASVIKRQGL